KLEKDISLIKDELDLIEDKVISTPDNKEIQKIFSIQKTVIRYQITVTGLAEMLLSFKSTENSILWNSNFEDFYNDIRIECNQLNTTINMINDILNSLLDTAGSIQANN